MDLMIAELNKIDDILHCPRCRLAVSRANVVVGDGPDDARLFFIGEAPGRKEDEAAKPFVGSAGKILSAALDNAGIDRKKAYITNVVKCRPPDNRVPKEDEIEACRPYLDRQLEIVKPDVVVLLGKTAAEDFLGRKVKMAEEHGAVMSHRGLKVLITYHPASVIYNRNNKEKLFGDIKKLRPIAFP